MLLAQSTTKDYIRAEHKLHSMSKVFISQVTSHIFEPIYAPRALNTGMCIRQGDLFYSAGLQRERERETERERERERQRQRDRETERDRDRERQRQRDRLTD